MSTTRSYQIDVIAGDGIGQEVMPAATACVDVVAEAYGFSISWRDRDWGSGHYRDHGRMMPVDGIEQLADGDAILLGAVGAPDIPDDVTLWGLLIPIRREFLQYVNLRPVRILPGVTSPLRDAEGLDMVIVRENVEGEYSEVGGRLYRGRPEEMAVQEAVFTRVGVTRIAKFAAAQAKSRRGLLDVGHQVERDHPHHALLGRGRRGGRGCGPVFEVDKMLIDALAARVVLKAAEPRRDRRLQPVRRHNFRSSRSRRRLDRRGAERQHQPAEGPPLDVRAGPRFGARHRRAGHRQSGGPDVGGRDDAGPPRRGRGRRPAERRPSNSALASGERTRDLGGTASTTEFTEAVLQLCSIGTLR